MVLTPVAQALRADRQLLELLRMSPLFPRLRTYYEDERRRRGK